MLIRRERPGDEAGITAVHQSAFGAGDGRTTAESELVDLLRASADWLPELSLVAVDEGAIVGHVVGSRGRVGESGDLSVGLGPLGVLPGRQGEGTGSALMHAVIAAAEARDESLLVLLGDPAYYARFGFLPAAKLGIGAPDEAWGERFQARALNDRGRCLRGAFRYAAAFDAMIEES